MKKLIDLTETLENYSEGPTSYWAPVCREAAREIKRLRQENKLYRAAYTDLFITLNWASLQRAKNEVSVVIRNCLDSACARIDKLQEQINELRGE